MNNNFHHRKPTRYKEYDYNLPGYYFITICTQGMDMIFGEINDGKMFLNKLGNLVDKYWTCIPKHFKTIEIDYYQIMPNHLHGIIIINGVGNANFAFPTDRTKMLLSKTIQQFKRRVTIDSKNNLNIKNKIWQKSFYDHIIHNEEELHEIRKYIEQNPLKWEYEKNTPENLDILI